MHGSGHDHDGAVPTPTSRSDLSRMVAGTHDSLDCDQSYCQPQGSGANGISHSNNNLASFSYSNLQMGSSPSPAMGGASGEAGGGRINTEPNHQTATNSSIAAQGSSVPHGFMLLNQTMQPQDMSMTSNYNQHQSFARGGYGEGSDSYNEGASTSAHAANAIQVQAMESAAASGPMNQSNQAAGDPFTTPNQQAAMPCDGFSAQMRNVSQNNIGIEGASALPMAKRFINKTSVFEQADQHQSFSRGGYGQGSGAYNEGANARPSGEDAVAFSHAPQVFANAAQVQAMEPVAASFSAPTNQSNQAAGDRFMAPNQQGDVLNDGFSTQIQMRDATQNITRNDSASASPTKKRSIDASDFRRADAFGIQFPKPAAANQEPANGGLVEGESKAEAASLEGTSTLAMGGVSGEAGGGRMNTEPQRQTATNSSITAQGSSVPRSLMLLNQAMQLQDTSVTSNHNQHQSFARGGYGQGSDAYNEGANARVSGEDAVAFSHAPHVFANAAQVQAMKPTAASFSGPTNQSNQSVGDRFMTPNQQAAMPCDGFGTQMRDARQNIMGDEGVSAPPMKKRFIGASGFGQVDAFGIQFYEPTADNQEPTNGGLVEGEKEAGAADPEGTAEAAENPFAQKDKDERGKKSDGRDDMPSDAESADNLSFAGVEEGKRESVSSLDIYVMEQLSKESTDGIGDDGELDPGSGNDPLETASKSKDGEDVPADADLVVGGPSAGGEDEEEDAPQPKAKDRGVVGGNIGDIVLAEPGCGMNSLVAQPEKGEEEAAPTDSELLESAVKVPSGGEEDEEKDTPQPNANDRGEVDRRIGVIEPAEPGGGMDSLAAPPKEGKEEAALPDSELHESAVERASAGEEDDEEDNTQPEANDRREVRRKMGPIEPAEPDGGTDSLAAPIKEGEKEAVPPDSELPETAVEALSAGEEDEEQGKIRPKANDRGKVGGKIGEIAPAEPGGGIDSLVAPPEEDREEAAPSDSELPEPAVEAPSAGEACEKEDTPQPKANDRGEVGGKIAVLEPAESGSGMSLLAAPPEEGGEEVTLPDSELPESAVERPSAREEDEEKDNTQPVTDDPGEVRTKIGEIEPAEPGGGVDSLAAPPKEGGEEVALPDPELPESAVERPSAREEDEEKDNTQPMTDYPGEVRTKIGEIAPAEPGGGVDSLAAPPKEGGEEVALPDSELPESAVERPSAREEDEEEDNTQPMTDDPGEVRTKIGEITPAEPGGGMDALVAPPEEGEEEAAPPDSELPESAVEAPSAGEACEKEDTPQPKANDSGEIGGKIGEIKPAELDCRTESLASPPEEGEEEAAPPDSELPRPRTIGRGQINFQGSNPPSTQTSNQETNNGIACRNVSKETDQIKAADIDVAKEKPAATAESENNEDTSSDAKPVGEMPFSGGYDTPQSENNDADWGKASKVTEQIEVAEDVSKETKQSEAAENDMAGPSLQTSSPSAAPKESDRYAAPASFAGEESEAEGSPQKEAIPLTMGIVSTEEKRIEAADEDMFESSAGDKLPETSEVNGSEVLLPAELPCARGESKAERMSKEVNKINTANRSDISKEREQIQATDEPMAEWSVGEVSSAVAREGNDGEILSADAGSSIKMSTAKESEAKNASKPWISDVQAREKTGEGALEIEAVNDEKTLPASAPNEKACKGFDPTADMPCAEAEGRVEVTIKVEASDAYGGNVYEETSPVVEEGKAAEKDGDKTVSPEEIAGESNGHSLPTSKEDNGRGPIYEKARNEGSYGREAETADASLPEGVNVAILTANDAMESGAEKPSVATTEGEGKLPPPAELPPLVDACLRGKFTTSGGVHRIVGIWALSLDTVESESKRDVCLDFEYEHQVAREGVDFHPSGRYDGWFHLNTADGGKLKMPEKDIDLNFIENSEGYHNVHGSGSNFYGAYWITGTLTADGTLTMGRKFGAKPKPKPKRTKKTVSRKPRSPVSKKRRSQSMGGTRKGDFPTKKKRKEVASHPDSGKRYGIGKPGLLCDCCFFEEDGELGQTPFIKCLYCGFVAHSACYPPISNVDEKGNFLCDVCVYHFLPSVNKEERTKKSEDGNARTPKPLAANIEAKGDGRVHEKGVFCQFCARSDVLGGMKPTDSNSWVHLACLMSTTQAYFQNKTALNIQGALKTNRAEVMKCKKPNQKCEGCDGQSGLLLKCKEKDCEVHLHPLCAEILDRHRVVEKIGSRDIISYKCALHSGLDACYVCKRSDRQHEMLECDKCGQGYHMACLTPPLTEIPEGDWFCAKCTTNSN